MVLGRLAIASAWPIAPQLPRCSTLTGSKRSGRNDRVSPAIALACSPIRQQPGRSTRADRTESFSPWAHPTAISCYTRRSTLRSSPMRPARVLLALSVLPLASSTAAKPAGETALLAGGCFWGMEAVFEHVKGVRNVVSGYAGGSAEEARYDKVSSERTGHAE